jgi:hypothetical protein
MLNKSTNPGISTAELVMKVCLIVSVAIGTFLILLALVFNRNTLEVAGDVIPLVALQWFFYLQARARKRSEQTLN